LLVKIALLENTKTKREKHRAKHVPVVNTVLLVPHCAITLQLLVLLEPMPMVLQCAIPVPVANTALLVHPVVRIFSLLVLSEPTPVGQQRVIHALLGNTKTKMEKHTATIIVHIPRYLHWTPDASTTKCTKHGRVASVATVVVVGVKLHRPHNVTRGRRRWVGGIRRRRLLGGCKILAGVSFILSILACASTPAIQTSAAPAMTNVSAHSLVHQAPTKIKVDSPLAKRVPKILTVLWVRPVVRILQLLVLLEPMPVGQQPFVIHVPVVNTALLVPTVVHIMQLLVLSEPTPVGQQRVIHALLGNTKTKREKHPATMIV